MVQGITFDKQLLASEDFAHQVNYFYQGKMGVSKGCEVSADVSGNLVISDGYFSIYGRLLKNVGDTAVEVPSVPSGTLYSSLVFEVDLTKENTIDAFNQGQFKIVSSADTYPALIQENLDNGGNIYQLEFARFENTVSGIVNLQDKRTILSMQMYTPQDDFNTHLAESANKHIKESGSNDDGHYIKYDDGTMICTLQMTVDGRSQYFTSRYDMLSSAATFPKEFVSIQSVNTTPIFKANEGKFRELRQVFVDGNMRVSLTVRFVTPESFTEGLAVDVFVTAIGRWKE